MERKLIRTHRDLEVHHIASWFVMQILRESNSFFMEERYSLTDQVCHPSRSVCANLVEAWRKRRYEGIGCTLFPHLPITLT